MPYHHNCLWLWHKWQRKYFIIKEVSQIRSISLNFFLRNLRHSLIKIAQVWNLAPAKTLENRMTNWHKNCTALQLRFLFWFASCAETLRTKKNPLEKTFEQPTRSILWRWCSWDLDSFRAKQVFFCRNFEDVLLHRCFHVVCQNINDAFLEHFLMVVFEKTFMQLLNKIIYCGNYG